MRGRTWPACASLKTGSQMRGPFVSPDTVSVTETKPWIHVLHVVIHSQREQRNPKVYKVYLVVHLIFLQISPLCASWTKQLFCKAATEMSLSFTEWLSKISIIARKYCSELKATYQSTASTVKGGVSFLTNPNYKQKILYKNSVQII